MKKFKINPKLRRMLIMMAVLSLLLASALELYTFGFPSGFFFRWIRSFFVIFVLMATTVLGIIPAVNYSVNKIFK